MKIRFYNLLKESAININQLPQDCFIAFSKHPDGPAYMNVYYSNKEGKPYILNNEPLGALKIGLASEDNGTPKAPAKNVWEVYSSKAQKGFGPLLYDVAMEFAVMAQQGHGMLKSDPQAVSKDAQAIWSYYLNNRPDVKATQLDSPENELTPQIEDNAMQSMSKTFFGKNWMKTPFSKGYSKQIQLLNSPKILWFNR